MIIGITGGIGSGKTTVANFFSQFKNVVIYIADEEAKKLMHTSLVIKAKLINEFGEECFKDKELNRPFLSKIVFNNIEKLVILNGIVHPEVRKHFQNFVNQNKDKAYIVYENAILFESKSNVFCDFIIAVFVPLEERIYRVSKRDKISRTAVLNRINNQWLEDKKLLQSNYIIFNNSTEETKKQVNRIHNILTKKIV